MNGFIITVSLSLIMTIPTNANFHALHSIISDTSAEIINSQAAFEEVLFEALEDIVEGDDEAELIVEEINIARHSPKGFG